MPLTHLARCETRRLTRPPVYLQRLISQSLIRSLSHATASHAGRLTRATIASSPDHLRSSRATLRLHTIPGLTMGGTQIRQHAGHSRGHGHSHDNTYLVSANKNDAGVKITRIGLFVNLGMAIGKGFGGYVFNSQALIADGFHALTDLVSDFMTLATISWSLKPPSERFPYGYGKMESLGALGVSDCCFLVALAWD